MKINELFVCSMPWDQAGFSMGWMFIFCMMFFLFFFLLFFLFFFRRMKVRDWCDSTMFHNACSGNYFTNTNDAREILKSRLAKGEINEREYDNLLRKISL